MTNETMTSASDFWGNDAFLRIIAAKHFPNDCFERYALLKAAGSFEQLWMLHHNLSRIHKHLEQLGAINTPDNIDITQLALYLENIAKGVPDKEASKAVKRASDMLHVWRHVNINLYQIMDMSSDFRFLGSRPAGEA